MNVFQDGPLTSFDLGRGKGSACRWRNMLRSRSGVLTVVKIELYGPLTFEDGAEREFEIFEAELVSGGEETFGTHALAREQQCIRHFPEREAQREGRSGNRAERPKTLASTRVNSAFCTGFGDTTLTGPGIEYFAIDLRLQRG